MSVQELQSEVMRLPAAEAQDFAKWLDEYVADLWDKQIEADIAAGKLDAAAARADQDFEQGRCTPL